jgi:exodeoxyribonuclease-1
MADVQLDFSDSRLAELLPRYKLRNFKRSTTAAEREHWESYRTKRITDGIQGQLSLDQFAKRLQELSAAKSGDDSAQFLLQELQLYAQNIAPIPE